MGRVGPKSEGIGNLDRELGRAGRHVQESDGKAEARIDGRRIDIEIVTGDGGAKSSAGASYDNSPQEARGCIEGFLSLALVLFAIGFPIYIVIAAFAGGTVPVLGIEFEGSIGEGFLALAASPVIFFLILLLSVFIPGRSRRVRMKRESRSDSRYR